MSRDPSTAPALDPRTPVLVGAGQVVQRVDDPRDGVEPLELMIQALARAADDAGAPDLLAHADSIRVPQGLWEYGNAAALLRERLGCDPAAQTVMAGISGASVHKLVHGAASEIARGERDVVLVVGAENEHSKRRARRAGVTLASSAPAPGAPDVFVGHRPPYARPPEHDAGLKVPTHWFALIENALRARAGRTQAEHRAHLGALWSGFNTVALGNPNAWVRKALGPDEITRPGPDNPMAVWPYTKYLCANMVVDQGAALIVCSAEAARRAGVPEERWIFPHAATECGEVPRLSERPHMDRELGMEIAGPRALELAGVPIDAVEHVDLYSCFPAAVQLAAGALRLPLDRPLTVTGGLTFAGGPFNSYVLHALATLVERLRVQPESFGLSTGVGGMLTTHTFGVYGARPPARGFRHEDLTAAQRARPTCRFVADHDGDATIESCAPIYRDGEPERLVLACRTAEGARTWATSENRDLLAASTRDELIGRRVLLRERRPIDVH